MDRLIGWEPLVSSGGASEADPSSTIRTRAPAKSQAGSVREGCGAAGGSPVRSGAAEAVRAVGHADAFIYNGGVVCVVVAEEYVFGAAKLLHRVK